MSRQWLYRSMLIFAGGVLLRADFLSLRSGKKVDGTFLGGNARQVDCLAADRESMRVRTIEAIDVDATKAGAKFRASLDDPSISGGSVVVPRGAGIVLLAAKVAQGGKFKGSDLLRLKVLSIKVGNKSHQVVTSLSETESGGEGKKTSKTVLGGASLSAIIAGIAGGGQGAGIGALAGAARGTIISATGELESSA